MQTRDTTSTAPSGSSSGSTGGTELGKDDFLKLMMAQLRYQDPLNPMDSSAYLAQLAQFANVEQLQTANGSLEGLLSAAANDQQLSAAALVGRQVVFENNPLSLQAGVPARGVGATVMGPSISGRGEMALSPGRAASPAAGVAFASLFPAERVIARAVDYLADHLFPQSPVAQRLRRHVHG